MSDMFDPSAISEGVFARLDIGQAAKLHRHLIDTLHHDELYAIFDKLAGVPVQTNKRPAEQLDQPLTVYVYGKDGERNLRIDEALDEAVQYHFPEGATVTKLRTQPLAFRVEDGTARQLIIRRHRKSRNQDPYWEVMNEAGFNQRSGKRAGQRLKGRSADRSFG